MLAKECLEEFKYENLLLSRTGRPLTKEALEHIFRQAEEKATVRSEIRCSPHTARHYYAQANLRNGLDVYSLSRLLGHENINITKRYLQSLQDSSIVEMAVHTTIANSGIVQKRVVLLWIITKNTDGQSHPPATVCFSSAWTMI